MLQSKLNYVIKSGSTGPHETNVKDIANNYLKSIFIWNFLIWIQRPLKSTPTEPYS